MALISYYKALLFFVLSYIVLFVICQKVNVPVRALLALLRRVLLVDGSLHNKKFPSTTSLHQELICFELPSLHSSFLDLLHATIKGMRRYHAYCLLSLLFKTSHATESM